MPDPIFAGPRVKIERAKRFIAELGLEVEQYLASNPGSVQIAMVNGEPKARVTIEPIGHMPSAIIGDCIHNLRTALDQMASELARINDKSDKDVYFPFSDGPNTFEAAIETKRFAKAGEDAVLLLKEFKPYRGGNDDLRAIHDLDIIDKHTAIIPPQFQFETNVQFTYDVNDPPSGTGTATVAGELTFPAGTSLAGRKVLSTLEELVEMVHGIIEAFASLVDERIA
jgi:hypothetical protein